MRCWFRVNQQGGNAYHRRVKPWNGCQRRFAVELLGCGFRLGLHEGFCERSHRMQWLLQVAGIGNSAPSWQMEAFQSAAQRRSSRATINGTASASFEIIRRVIAKIRVARTLKRSKVILRIFVVGVIIVPSISVPALRSPK